MTMVNLFQKMSMAKDYVAIIQFHSKIHMLHIGSTAMTGEDFQYYGPFCSSYKLASGQKQRQYERGVCV